MNDFNIDTALASVTDRFDEWEQEKFAQTQTDLRAANADRLDPLSPQATSLRASRQEADITANIVMLVQEPDSELKQTRLYQALDRLSELLAEQGAIQKAIEICPNAERKQYFQSLLTSENGE